VNAFKKESKDRQAIVKAPEWRDWLLNELNKSPDLLRFVNQSRSRNSEAGLTVGALQSRANEIMKAVPKEELMAARQYYNNAHLLHFWGALSAEYEKMIQANVLNRDFPLFDLQVNHQTGQYRIKPLTMDFINSVNYEMPENARKPIEGVMGIPVFPPPMARKRKSKKGQARLDRLFLKLSLANKVYSATTTAFYDIFLQQHRNSSSYVWDCYKLHCFLDNFLYVDASGTARRSPFEFVFLNSDIYELKVFLQDRYEKSSGLLFEDVAAFLERQRAYYLKYAVTVSLKENEVHNRHKELLHYDEKRGIVVPSQDTRALQEKYDREVIRRYGVHKQGGCPFAKSKGIRMNAMLELLEFVDNIFLKLTVATPEFAALYSSTQKT